MTIATTLQRLEIVDPEDPAREFEPLVQKHRPTTPICCSLEAGEYRARVAWIAALNRDALVSEVREGQRLELIYAPEAAEWVAEMVRREKACCPFLTFDLWSDKRQARLVITAPPEAEDAETLFTVFRSRG